MMTDEEREQLVQEVKQLLWDELRSTIPPSQDIMRGIAFATAAEKAVDLCLKRSTNASE